MALKRIAARVELPPGLGDRIAVGMACRLAVAHEAEVNVLAYVTEVLPDRPSVDVGPMAFEKMRDDLHRIGSANGVKLTVQDRSSFAHGGGEVFADQLRVSDLGVLHYPLQPSIAAKMVATAAIFHGGAPVLLLPGTTADQGPPASVLVGWDGSAAAARALRAAVAVGGHGCRITVAGIEDTGEFRPGQSGIEAAHLAAMHGADASFVVLEGKGDPALEVLERHCASTGMDLLSVGAVRHGALHEMLFGSLTTGLLSNGPRRATLLVA